MSTGSTEGYNAEVFIAQGSTRFENAGQSKYYANHYEIRLASTLLDGSTIPVGQYTVVNNSSAGSYTMGAPKLGAVTTICVSQATTSAAQTFLTGSTAINFTGIGTAANNSLAIALAGFVELYCPSTSLFVIKNAPFTAGSSDVVIGASS
jgi:hypothetical protein